MHDLFAVLLAFIVVFLVSIAQVYRLVPLIELKRRARYGDDFAESIYKVASYGPANQLVLWLLIVLSAAGFFVLIVKTTPIWFSLTISFALLWIGFVWIPRTAINLVSQYLAVLTAPAYAKLLRLLYPILKHSNKRINSMRANSHTRLYEKQDIIELLHKQSHQPDNRIEAMEIDLLTHALSFNDKTVSDVMVPRSKVSMVSADDMIGPIVLTELHKTGYSYFPVYEGKKTNIVGVLEIEPGSTKFDGQKVSNVMIKKMLYMNEQQYLSEALSIITRIRHPIFMVINDLEEYVGVITAQDILAQLIGDTVVDDLNVYEDKQFISQQFKHAEEITEKESTEPDELVE